MDISLELKDIGRVLKKTWWLIAVFIIIGFFVSFFNAQYQMPQYTADAKFIVGSSIPPDYKQDYYAYAITHNLVNTCAGLATSDTVLSEAAAKINSKLTPSQIYPMVNVKLTAGSDLLELQLTSKDGKMAADLLNAIVDATANHITSLENTVPAKLTVIDKATYTPGQKSMKSKLKSGGLGGLIGLFVSLAVLLLINSLSSRIKKEEAFKRITGLDSLGIIPEFDANHTGFIKDALGIIKTNIRAGDKNGNCIAIVSPGPLEGRTAFAKGLSAAFCEAGFKTLLLEADFRKPALSSQLNQKSGGFAEYFDANGAAAEDINKYIIYADNGPDVLTAGQNASKKIKFIDSIKTESLLSQLRESYDYIIIDTPALNFANEAAAVSQMADSAVLLLKYNRTKFNEAEFALNRLRRAGANVAGFVISGVPEGIYCDFLGEKYEGYNN